MSAMKSNLKDTDGMATFHLRLKAPVEELQSAPNPTQTAMTIGDKNTTVQASGQNIKINAPDRD